MFKQWWRFLVVLLFCACAGDQQMERLEKIESVGALHQLERSYTNDSSFVFLDQALEIIRTIKDAPDSLLIENTFRRGYVFLRGLGNYDSAIVYLQRAIDLIPLEDGRARNEVYFRNTWECYWQMGKYKNSAAIAQQYLDKPEETQSDVALYYAYNALQRVSLELQQPEEALDYSEKALAYAQKSGIKAEYDNQLLAKANIYFYHQENQEAAAREVLESLQVREDSLHPSLKRRLYLHLGFLDIREKAYQQSIENFETAAHVTREINDSFFFHEDLAECLANMANAYKFMGRYETAIQYLDSTVHYASQTTRTDILSYCAKQRFEIAFLRKEQLASATQTFQEMIDAQTRIYTDRMDEELASLRASSEKEKTLLQKNQQIALDNAQLGRQRTILFASVAIALLIIVIIGLFYYQRKLRFEKKGLQMQQRLLRSQMNPHFTYNTLYTIQTLIDQDPEKAGIYLVKFSRLLRLVLENSTLDYVELDKELESVKKYLDLQLLRFPGRFTYEIKLEKIDEDDFLFIPPMLIQPFVENSIEHGFQGIDYEGRVTIVLRKSGRYLVCEISDNGIGIHAEKKDHKESLSGALIADFIEKATQRKIMVQDRSSIDDAVSGVVVKFSIPYKMNEYA
ncbi:MAG: histidine kinase [Bacteroidota bacterium]